MPGLVLVGIAAALLSAGMIVWALRRPVKTPPVTEKSLFTGEFAPNLQRELSKLALPQDKVNKAVHVMSALVDQEIHKRVSDTKRDITRTYEQLIQNKDQAIRKAEEKFVTMAVDLKRAGTARKRTDNVVRSLAEGRVVVSKEGKTLLVNPAAEKILGRKKEEMVGLPVADLKGRQQVISFVKDLMQSEEDAVSLLSENEEVSRKVRGTTAVIETESGETRGMIAVLPEVIQERETESVKTEFISSVTHELRAPLVCIQKSLSAVLEGELGAVSPEQKNYLEIAERNSNRLSELINQILDFSRLESGQAHLRKTLFSVQELLEETTASLMPWANDKKIALAFEVLDAELALEADRPRILQVLTNLISNALKFTPEGGSVKVSAAIAQPSDRFIPEMGLNFVQFQVEDTGTGIPASEIEKIFDKFTQGSGAASVSEKGTGLGLSIVREIVRLHKGRVWAESGPGPGSRFTFLIPQYQS